MERINNVALQIKIWAIILNTYFISIEQFVKFCKVKLHSSQLASLKNLSNLDWLLNQCCSIDAKSNIECHQEQKKQYHQPDC